LKLLNSAFRDRKCLQGLRAYEVHFDVGASIHQLRIAANTLFKMSDKHEAGPDDERGQAAASNIVLQDRAVGGSIVWRHQTSKIVSEDQAAGGDTDLQDKIAHAEPLVQHVAQMRARFERIWLMFVKQ